MSDVSTQIGCWLAWRGGAAQPLSTQLPANVHICTGPDGCPRPATLGCCTLPPFQAVAAQLNGAAPAPLLPNSAGILIACSNGRQYSIDVLEALEEEG